MANLQACSIRLTWSPILRSNQKTAHHLSLCSRCSPWTCTRCRQRGGTRRRPEQLVPRCCIILGTRPNLDRMLNLVPARHHVRPHTVSHRGMHALHVPADPPGHKQAHGRRTPMLLLCLWGRAPVARHRPASFAWWQTARRIHGRRYACECLKTAHSLYAFMRARSSLGVIWCGQRACLGVYI